MILTNNPQSISKVIVNSNSIADHELTGCVRKINNMKYKPKSVFTRDYKNYVLLQENFYDIDDVNIAANIFRTYLKDIFDQHASIKSKTHKGKLAVWLRADLKKQINKKINFYVKLGNQKQLRIGQHTSVQEINVMGKFVNPNANITATLWKKTKRTLESFGTKLK